MMSNCNFRVGQRVAYVGHKNHGKYQGYTYPSLGSVYTIRGFVKPGVILLAEILNEKDGWEPGFGASGFRAVVERKTDISCFKAMLPPSEEQVSA